uniref:Glycoside hydrolase family 5 domain-containing protein n=1 Tax=Chromera velia CCMP2878 TaxID=1169474 RepID=A0A0G4I4S0_9ALVE|eukprot:Cvel_10945.t1-p1 / transcript=Cvel_10945.t1 / gene=Cvel_10945 / organism=Chromera_velia_CCMP2878 / gene_product=Endoglycoceramidase, putative / transcript_product=Endoglycoceramidase, putative / location=Cvel_scaffold673:21542-23669(+) / protein_length=557 / sequence_SO=supercontig / SO=protein_coding / is_pseudo=false
MSPSESIPLREEAARLEDGTSGSSPLQTQSEAQQSKVTASEPGAVDSARLLQVRPSETGGGHGSSREVGGGGGRRRKVMRRALAVSLGLLAVFLGVVLVGFLHMVGVIDWGHPSQGGVSQYAGEGGVERVTIASVPRNVRISGKKFVSAATGESIVMEGPNVVVKGPPYLPSVEGETVCEDFVNKKCRKEGTCSSCQTFNEADIKHMKEEMGWNTIRLGVVWAGAQPRDEDALDSDFLNRLKAILSLTDKHGIHVILDNHGDMVGSAGCGNGVPMWFQQMAAPDLIGKPLTTSFPFSLVPSLRVKRLKGYERCGSDVSRWAEHAGDPDYNLKNQCCQAMNSDNPGALGFSSLSQKTMDYLVRDGPGRQKFVRFWRLLAEAVRDHPSAFAAELMNEPMTLKRRHWYNTARAAAEAVNRVIPDMSVSVCDIGEGVVMPAWVAWLFGPGMFIDRSTVAWMKQRDTLFYAWHWYGMPKKAKNAVKTVKVFSEHWNMPSFATEFGDCEAWTASKEENISHTYWHYSAYCNTGPAFGNREAPSDTFGACILGWASGNASKKCD